MGVVSINDITPVSGWKWGFRRIFTHPDHVPDPIDEIPDVNVGP